MQQCDDCGELEDYCICGKRSGDGGRGSWRRRFIQEQLEIEQTAFLNKNLASFSASDMDLIASEIFDNTAVRTLGRLASLGRRCVAAARAAAAPTSLERDLITYWNARVPKDSARVLARWVSYCEAMGKKDSAPIICLCLSAYEQFKIVKAIGGVEACRNWEACENLEQGQAIIDNLKRQSPALPATLTTPPTRTAPISRASPPARTTIITPIANAPMPPTRNPPATVPTRPILSETPVQSTFASTPKPPPRADPTTQIVRIPTPSPEPVIPAPTSDNPFESEIPFSPKYRFVNPEFAERDEEPRPSPTPSPPAPATYKEESMQPCDVCGAQEDLATSSAGRVLCRQCRPGLFRTKDTKVARQPVQIQQSASGVDTQNFIPYFKKTPGETDEEREAFLIKNDPRLAKMTRQERERFFRMKGLIASSLGNSFDKNDEIERAREPLNTPPVKSGNSVKIPWNVIGFIVILIVIAILTRQSHETHRQRTSEELNAALAFLASETAGLNGELNQDVVGALRGTYALPRPEGMGAFHGTGKDYETFLRRITARKRGDMTERQAQALLDYYYPDNLEN